MPIQRVGILGAGAMGNGIAHVAALAGLDIVLVDTARPVLDKSLATMAKNLAARSKNPRSTPPRATPPSPASPPRPPTTPSPPATS
jgi:3-hydroxyacyl-CoA dehydrogenase (EC 1.1.1.35)